MDIITLLDTSVATDNLGDEIIMDAVQDAVLDTIPGAYCFRVATHEYMSWVSRRLIKKSRVSFVGGSNLLSSKMGMGALWKLAPWDVVTLKDIVLLGVGWRDYMGEPDRYTKWMLRTLLDDKYIHSVRDSYTQGKLSISGKRTLNTACPTMWSLTPEHCAKIPHTKAQSVVTTLTYYNQDIPRDTLLLSALTKEYKNVYFWSQQSGDQPYLESLGVKGIKIIPPNLRAFTKILVSEDCDFIGTRLHGGIRAMQKGRRTLIVGIDNRAKEIAKDFDLPVMDRSDISGITEWIHGSKATEVRLPVSAIVEWKTQFAKAL